jgi:hypothetical protein
MSWLRRKPSAPAPGSLLRELLYGDVPLVSWRSESTDAVSARFQAAAAASERGAKDQAVALLSALASDSTLESRDQVEAWRALAGLGAQPDPGQRARVLGVVLDVPVEDGLDTLAAYADGSARYVNQAGGVAVVESAPAHVRALVAEVVAVGQQVAALIGPWPGPRPVLEPGLARVSLLCPDALYFGQGPADLLMADPLAGPVFAAGTRLVGAISDAAA